MDMHNMWFTTATFIQNKKKSRHGNNIYICSQKCFYDNVICWKFKEDTSKKKIKYNEAHKSLIKDWKIKEKYTVCLTST